LKLRQKLNVSITSSREKVLFLPDLGNPNRENSENCEKIREIVRKVKIKLNINGKSFSIFSKGNIFKKSQYFCELQNDKKIVENMYHIYRYLFQLSSVLAIVPTSLYFN